MKRILLIAFLIIPFLGFSQTTKPIEGFLGIKFGDSKAKVTEIIKAKGGQVSNITDEKLNFSNISLGKRETVQFTVSLYNDQVYSGVLVFKPENDPSANGYYNALVSDLSEVYGKGEAHRVFKSPYTDGDGNEILAIDGGYANIYHQWIDKDKNRIIQASIISLQSDLYIKLVYKDNGLGDAAIKKEKDKAKGDL